MRKTADGEKIYYKCTKIYGCKCPVTIFLHLSADRDEVTLYKQDVEHDHSTKWNKVLKETFGQTKILFNNGIKASSDIYMHWGIKELKNQQNINKNIFKKNWGKKNYGEAKIDLNAMKDWCRARNDVPDDEDQLFVGIYIISLDENNKPIFPIFVTSKRCRLNCCWWDIQANMARLSGFIDWYNR